ncbi:MAG: coproporphyrinogen III oxidase [Candidatus Schekmanbacteria bacterium]|nr:coproporphyrinogen III oxidase [Candidatus Schekmanbacteria bacterium]
MSHLKEVDAYFEDLKNRTLSAFGEIDKAGKVDYRKWDTPLGLMEVRAFKGDVFEKAGVSYSALKVKHPKTGIAADVRVFEILTYMTNPKVPTAAISLRYRVNGGEMFMGCCDLSPAVIIDDDLKEFEDEMKKLSKKYGKDFAKMQERLCWLFTSQYSKKMVLGGKGIAYDIEAGGFDFFKESGDVFLATSLEIIKRRKDEPYTVAEKDKQLYGRGEWVQFNLMEDKGFVLGVQVGVPPEAMNFQTLPPLAKFCE